MRSRIRSSTPGTGHAPRVAGLRPRARPCLLDGMQGVLVVLVPVLIAGFVLLMDRFEARILAEPEVVEPGTDGA